MLFIFETHPVQYRAPVYRELQKLRPGSFRVFYATDCSIRGHIDRGFGKSIQWDTPLLEGYPSTVLNNESGIPLTTWNSLHGRGLFSLLRRERPRAIMLCQFSYAYSAAALISAKMLSIPVWIRMETQDDAFKRSIGKSTIRRVAYRALYRRVDRAFFIGKKNADHLLRHGLKPAQLTRSPYCVENPLENLTQCEKLSRRSKLRERLGIQSDAIVIGFFGKLIPKKNPDLIFRAVMNLPEHIKKKVHLLFVGTGELEGSLRDLAAKADVKTVFAGFVNQSEIAVFYLAVDQMILPSRVAGETWGLVVNEALHAGCSVIVSEAVGCAAEFGEWERVRVIPVGDANACAVAIGELANFSRSYDWCASRMKTYSVKAAAEAIAAFV